MEELRHGVDVVLEEDRQEELADDQQGQRRHPFVGSDCEPDGVARPGHADDLLGRNIGRDQRSADRPPRQVLRREEVIAGVFLVPGLFPTDPLCEAEDADRVDDDDGEIDR
jgi:hypothetical protein